jgi:FlaA1/EpsC-like NDP-sugar epimerase
MFLLPQRYLFSFFVFSLSTFQRNSLVMASTTGMETNRDEQLLTKSSPDLTNHPQSRRAVVVGSTGATGKQVVKKLLERNWFVTTVSRREYDYELSDEDMKTRLTQIISNFSDKENLIEKWNHHDALFNCLGKEKRIDRSFSSC